LTNSSEKMYRQLAWFRQGAVVGLSHEDDCDVLDHWALSDGEVQLVESVPMSKTVSVLKCDFYGGLFAVFTDNSVTSSTCLYIYLI
jgi:hypothetical protein